MSAPLIPTSQVDYLDEDKPIRGQNYVCLSFLSPEDVIQNNEVFMFSKYIGKASNDLKALFENLRNKYPDDKGLFYTIAENHDYLFDASKLNEDFRFFKSVHGANVDAEFNANNNFRTSVRGIKVRGVFDTLPEAQSRAEFLKKMGDKFDIFVGQVGCWCPWSPNPEDLQDAVYAESQLNTLMSKYKDNMSLKDAQFEERKQAKIEAAAKERQEKVQDVTAAVMEQEDPWTARQEAGAEADADAAPSE